MKVTRKVSSEEFRERENWEDSSEGYDEKSFYWTTICVDFTG